MTIMRFINVFFLFLFSFVAIGQQLFSPDKLLKMEFGLNASGTPVYELVYKNNTIISPSELGIETRELNLNSGFTVAEVVTSSVDETWQPVLGEYQNIRNNYNELKVTLLHAASGVKLNLIFRLFNDGLGFRYALPFQNNIGYFELMSENTQFNLNGDHTAYWISGDFDSQEYPYNQTLLSEIDNEKVNMNNGIALKSIGGRYSVQSPLLLKTANKIFINIFEAAVDNYPVMHLDLTKSENKFSFSALLPGNTVNSKAFLRTPFQSPWRTIIVSDDARNIIAANRMILNLNEPNKIPNAESWVKPMKYVGIWWEMHAGIATWDYMGPQSMYSPELIATATPSGKHGATTANTKRYIDFAAKHGFDGVLVEGWNIGWEDWFGKWKEDVFDFVTPYPDFDLNEVYQYAKSKGVKMLMHHETSGSVANYERHLDRAMQLMKQYEYPGVKTGYVGRIIPRGEFHDGQIMVNHFNHVVKRMAENQLMVNSHESTRPTGMHRTYPNYVAAEAARGNEFNAWSGGNPPAHETILPFTRLMGGPMDYTPGIFEIKLNIYSPENIAQVRTTLAKQLALYVTMYSPLQMAADLPQNYEKYLDAFQFIKDVAVDWQDTRVLEAEPNDYLTIARKAKGSEDWYLGAITDENARTSEIKLDFLTPGKKYKAVIYTDGKDADWKSNPKSYSIRTQEVTSKSSLKLQLAKGGGAAISFKPI